MYQLHQDEPGVPLSARIGGAIYCICPLVGTAKWYPPWNAAVWRLWTTPERATPERASFWRFVSAGYTPV